jgi:adenylate cyclase
MTREDTWRRAQWPPLSRPVLLPDVHRQQTALLTRPCSVERESEISPGTVPPAPPPKDNPSHRPRKPANWDGPTPSTFGHHRKQLAVLETSGGRVPSISRNPPTASSANSQVAPWSTAPNANNMANSVWSSFFNDSNEDVSQSSPGFRPGTGTREDSMGFPVKDDRRPSVASATTVSSTGSKSSMGRNFHKRLQNVFGEDFPADDRQNSDSSLGTPQRNRGNSLSNTIGSKHQSRPTSPTSSRPRTPQASSEVTPWEFQDSKVSLFTTRGRRFVFCSHAPALLLYRRLQTRITNPS